MTAQKGSESKRALWLFLCISRKTLQMTRTTQEASYLMSTSIKHVYVRQPDLSYLYNTPFIHFSKI